MADYTSLPQNAFGTSGPTGFGQPANSSPSLGGAFTSSSPSVLPSRNNLFGAIGQTFIQGIPTPLAGIGQLTFPQSSTNTTPKGTSFNPAAAQAYSSAPTGAANQTVAAGAGTPGYTYTNGVLTSVGGKSTGADTQGLGQYLTNTTSGANGSTLTTDAQGNPISYNAPVGYSIDTGGSLDSSALDSGTGVGDVMNQQGSYQDYVNALAQAQGYSPQYVAAQSGVYGAQAQGAALGVSQAAAANQAFGSNQANNGNGMNNGSLGGATTDFVSGTIGAEQSGIALQQAQNTQQQTGANIALNAAQLQRTGNIAAAQTELQSSPTGMAGAQAITQYQQLQQQYPGAGIPAFNPSADPIQQYNMAAALVANSPAYQAGFQSTYTTAGGGTGIYSKLNLSGLQQNSDGSYTLVPAAAAALGAANAANVSTNLQQMSQINAAINSSTQTLQTTTSFMNQYGINQSGVSILSQLQLAVGKQTAPAGAVAAWQADLNALRSDYAQYLTGRSGSIAGTNDEAASAIPDTVSPDQLAQIVGQMQVDGQNTANSLGSQVNEALAGIMGNSNNSTSGSTTGGTPQVSQMNF